MKKVVAASISWHIDIRRDRTLLAFIREYNLPVSFWGLTNFATQRLYPTDSSLERPPIVRVSRVR